MATKAQLIGNALLKVEGGQPDPQSSVRWGEMETYLAYSVNYLMVGQYWAENKSEGGHNVNSLLYTIFENVAIQTDSTTGRKFFTMPQRLITLPKSRALEVNTMCGKMCFPLNQGDNALEQYYGCLKKSISYYPEGQTRVWLYNVPALVSAIRTKQWVHIADLDDGDEVILPSDGDTKVVDLMVQFFTGQRQIPEDHTQDNKDN